jgi:type IV pilus assembly protein PilC
LAAFNYEVVDRAGNLLSGVIAADNEELAAQKLKEQGYLVVQLKSQGSRRIGGLALTREKKVSHGDKTIFTRQLATMLNAGIPITRALFTLSEQASNPTLKKALGTIAANIESGMSIINAFNEYPSIFDQMYLGMIRAGEVGGTLGDTLVRLSDQMQKDKLLKDNIRSATMYPTAVVSFAILMLIAMLIFMVPIFQGFFPENIELPLITQLIINLSESLRSYWFLWIGVIALFILLIYLYVKTESGAIMLERIRLKLPGFGPLYHRTVLARFSRTFATLFANGIPVIRALESSGMATGSRLIQMAINEAVNEIQEGKNIGETFSQKNFFPPIVSQMISVGEETGSLPELLDKIAEFYEDEVSTMSKTLTSMIEPILLIFVGLVVGGMLVALYIPIFTAITQSAA